MDANNLNRYSGTFEAVGISAAMEGVRVAETYARNSIVQKKDAEIDLLIDECDALEDDYDALRSAYLILKKKYEKQVENHNSDIDDYNKLATKHNALLVENEELRDVNKKLKGKVENSAFENEIKMDEIEENNVKANKENEASFAALYKSINASKQNTEFSLKVSFTQNKIHKGFVGFLISQRIISEEMYDAYFAQKLFDQNSLDISRGAITYDESMSWLKTHNRTMHEKVCIKSDS